MSKTRHRFLAGLLLAMGVFCVVCVILPREPHYQGKPLRLWLRYLTSHLKEDRRQAETAVREMGAEALPRLVKMVVTEDSFLREKLIEISNGQRIVRFKVRSWNEDRNLAASAFSALGPVAKQAVPTLSRGLSCSEWRVRKASAFALGGIGEEARDAVPALIALLADSNEGVREEAAMALARIGGPAIPALIAVSKAEKVGVRYLAVLGLTHFVEQHYVVTFEQRYRHSSLPEPMRHIAKDIVSALVLRLEDGDARIRRLAASALGNLDQEGREAIPALVKVSSDPDKEVQQAALHALMQLGHIRSYSVPVNRAMLQLPANSPR